jgi:hypothetical protein
MIKNLFNISGAKVLSNVAQKDIKGGGPVLLNCAGTGICPPGYCCNGGSCIDDTPINGTIPPCDPF